MSSARALARRFLIYSAFACAATGKPHRPHGGSPRIPLPVHPKEHPWQTTLCFVDTSQGAFSLGEAGSYLAASVQNCPNASSSRDKAVCAASIGSAMEAVAYVATYVAASFKSCVTTTVHLPMTEAACASDIAGFANGLFTAWGAAASLASGTCKNATVPDSVDRRLSAEEQKQSRVDEVHMASGQKPAELLAQLADEADEGDTPEERARRVSKSLCAFDVGQALFYLTRTTVAIHGSSEICRPHPDQEDRALCTVSIAGMLGALIYTALYIDLIFVNCPGAPMKGSECAADIMAALTVFTSLIASSADLDFSCGELPSPGEAPLWVPDRKLREEALWKLRRYALPTQRV